MLEWREPEAEGVRLLSSAIAGTSGLYSFCSGAPAIPNFSEGWGRVDLQNVIETGIPTFYHDQTYIFGNPGSSAPSISLSPIPGCRSNAR